LSIGKHSKVEEEEHKPEQGERRTRTRRKGTVEMKGNRRKEEAGRRREVT
jgi:hypothetical protein